LLFLFDVVLLENNEKQKHSERETTETLFVRFLSNQLKSIIWKRSSSANTKMLVEDDDDEFVVPKISLKEQMQNAEKKREVLNKHRLQSLMAKKEITYHMKSRTEKLQAKIEQLFERKREELYAIRIKNATVTAINGNATLGNEYALRLELLSQMEQQKIKYGLDQQDPYQYKQYETNLQQIRSNVVNARDPIDGRNPLHCAITNGHFHIVRMLCYEFHADIQRPTVIGLSTPLHLAVSNEQRSIASLLLSLGADVNCKDKQGNTPLHYVHTLKMAKLLGKFHINPMIRNKANLLPREFYQQTTNGKEYDMDLIDYLRHAEDYHLCEKARIQRQQEKEKEEREQQEFLFVNSKSSIDEKTQKSLIDKRHLRDKLLSFT
jgi:hypothetical protein